MLPEIEIEETDASDIPAGRGRPGPVIPKWLMDAIEASARGGKWMSARVSEEHAEELGRLLHYVHRSTRIPYRIQTRNEALEDATRVHFHAEHVEAA